MSGLGQGYLCSVGVGEQSDLQTANASPSLWLPHCRSTLELTRKWVDRGTLLGLYFGGGSPAVNRQVLAQLQGPQEVGGALNMPFLAGSVAELFKAWNGRVSTVAMPGSITGTPSLTVQAGGSLTASSTYYYRVGHVLQRALDSALFFSNPSPESFSASTTGSNRQIQVTWSNATIPTGYTLFGTAIWRTSPGGGSGNEYFVDIVVGSGTSYTDNGSSPLRLATPPAPLYKHTMSSITTLSSPSDGLVPLTVQVNTDNGTASQYAGCYVDRWMVEAPAGSAAVRAEFELIGLVANSVALGEASYANADQPMGMAHRAQAAFGGSGTANVQDWRLQGTNAITREMPKATSWQTYRGLYPGVRSVSGNVTLTWENYTQYNAVITHRSFGLTFYVDGAPVTPSAYVTLPAEIYAWPEGAVFDLPSCVYEGAGGPLSGPQSLTETVPFRARALGAGADDASIVIYSRLATITA